MYRVIRIMADGGYTILTRSRHSNGWRMEPVFTAIANDDRIKEYGTKTGALKAQASLIRSGYNALVIDSAEGVEIKESENARMAAGLA